MYMLLMVMAIFSQGIQIWGVSVCNSLMTRRLSMGYRSKVVIDIPLNLTGSSKSGRDLTA